MLALVLTALAGCVTEPTFTHAQTTLNHGQVARAGRDDFLARDQAIQESLASTIDGDWDKVQLAVDQFAIWMNNGAEVRIVGLGRARLAASMAANRLAHGGAHVSVIGDIAPTANTSLKGGLIAASASGKTLEVLSIMRTAKARGLVIVGFSNPKAQEFKDLCDVFVPIYPAKKPVKMHALADLDEQAIAELADAIVVAAGMKLGYTEEKWKEGHENIETGVYENQSGVDFDTLAKRLDPTNHMINALDRFGSQFEAAGMDPNFPDGDLRPWKDIGLDRVVGCGMGASAFHYDIANAVGLTRQPLLVVSDYAIPSGVDLAHALVIVSSYSGNTEESVACFNQASKGGARVVVVTHDRESKLAVAAANQRAPLVLVTGDKVQPRVAMGYYFVYLARILEDTGFISSLPDIKRLREVLDQNREQTKARAKKLAPHLSSSTVMFYAGDPLRVAARIAKTVVNETGKSVSFSSVLPEANHNEIEGFERATGRFGFIYLRDPEDNPMITKRFTNMVPAIKECSAIEIVDDTYEPKGQTRLERTYSALMWAHYLGYYMALANNVEPEPVPLIDGFKKKMAK